jgi:hypothetical protein
LFELRLFFGYKDTKKLVSETLICDHKVEESDLRGYFGQVMRVPQLGRHVELELVVVLDRGITDLDVLRSTTLGNLLLQKWLDSGI